MAPTNSLRPNVGGWLRRAGPGLFLLALTLLFFAPYLLPSAEGPLTLLPYDALRLLSPWHSLGPVPVDNPIMGDVFSSYMPWRLAYRQALLSGEIPFWNPYSLGGLPFLANQQAQVLYPFSLVFLLLPFETAYLVFVLLHVWLAGLGLYLLLRRLERSTPAALLGAVVWMFSGFMTVWMLWYSIPSTLAWLPWLLLAAEAVLAGGGRRPLAGFALAVALTLLGGLVQFAYYGFLLLGAFTLWRWFALALDWRAALLRIAQLAGGFALGLALALPQFAPTLEMASLAQRGQEEIGFLMQATLAWPHLVTLLDPLFYGDVRNYSGRGNFVEFSAYLGASSLVFVALGAVLGLTRRRRESAWFFLPVALLALHLAYGGELNRLFAYLPAYTSFRGLQRLMSVFSLAVAALAAAGLDVLQPGERGFKRPALALLAGLIGLGLLLGLERAGPDSFQHLRLEALAWPLAALALSGLILAAARLAPALSLAWRTPDTAGPRNSNYRPLLPWLLLLPVLLTAADLTLFARRYLPQTPQPWGYLATPGADFLAAQPDLGRVARFDTLQFAAPFFPNTMTVYGMRQIEGYDSFALRRYNQLADLIEPGRLEVARAYNFWGNFQDPAALASPLLDMLNTAFLVTRPEVPLELVNAPGWELVYAGADMHIWRNLEARPPAYLLGQAAALPAEADILAALGSPTFDPARQAFLTQTPAQPLDPNAGGEVQLLSRTFNAISLQAEVQAAPGQAALLVLSENAYPGWCAWVDGQPAQILTVNHVHQGLLLTAGAHRVEFRFAPSYFGWWLALAGLALAALLGMIAWPARK